MAPLVFRSESQFTAGKNDDMQIRKLIQTKSGRETATQRPGADRSQQADDSTLLLRSRLSRWSHLW